MRAGPAATPVRTAGSAGSGRLPQAVTGPPDGLDAVDAEGPVDALPQRPHVHVDEVGGALVGEVPDVLEQVGPGQHLSGPAHELLQDGELLGRQGDLDVAPPDLAAGGG